MAQPVIATKQVQCRVQVRVNLVYSVTDRLQGHSPVWSLWFVFAGGHARETSARVQTQQEHTDVAVVPHSPRNVRARDQRLPAHWFNDMADLFLKLWSSQVSLLLVFISLPAAGGTGLPAAAVDSVSGLDAVT